MKDFSTFQIDELKLVYRVLHRNLMENMELMDTDFLQGLQSWLQFRAGRDGIDIADHAQWDAWLRTPGPAAVAWKPPFRRRTLVGGGCTSQEGARHQWTSSRHLPSRLPRVHQQP